jgi:hypothetical protein
MKGRGLLTVIACLGLAAAPIAVQGGAYPYDVAAYLPASLGSDTDTLKLFPFEGAAVTIALPFRLSGVMFAADGKSAYGFNASGENGIYRNLPGLAKIEFNPTRLTPVLGTIPFVFIKSLAISARQDKLVISGNRLDSDGRRCGVFEILLPAGNVRQILKSDCRYQWAWDKFSLSPDGAQAIATVGSNTDHDLHLELIDLVRGTARSFGRGFRVGVWSPDGNWIAALGNGNHKLFLMDAHDLSKRRSLGSASAIKPTCRPTPITSCFGNIICSSADSQSTSNLPQRSKR